MKIGKVKGIIAALLVVVFLTFSGSVFAEEGNASNAGASDAGAAGGTATAGGVATGAVVAGAAAVALAATALLASNEGGNATTGHHAPVAR